MGCIFGGKMGAVGGTNGAGENGSCGSCMAGGAGAVCTDFFLPYDITIRQLKGTNK
jgi:hypothetical protein